jgi:hypothetical protein
MRAVRPRARGASCRPNVKPDRPDSPPRSDSAAPATAAGPLLARALGSRAEEIRRSRRLFGYGLGAIALCLCFYSYRAQVADPFHLYLGQIIIILSVLPSLLWAKRAKFGLPLFEVFMLTGINTYGIPLLGGHQALASFDADVITRAAVAVVLFQVVANVAFAATTARPGRSDFWTREIIDRETSNFLGYGMAITSAYTVISSFTDWIPGDLTGIVRAVCYGVGIISTFIQCRRWGQNELPRREKITFTVLLLIQVIFSFASLFLVAGLSILVLGLLGYVSSSKQIPMVAIAIALGIIGVLHNGKSVMREKYWDGGYPKPTITEVPGFFVEWVGYGLDPEIQAKRDDGNQLIERTSLFHVMCLVVSLTPERLPYLEGETYAQIPGQFVPRPFWPEKPVGHISTYTLSVYYGLQRMEETEKTTIGFGLLTEAYANFGFFGLGFIGAFFGILFKTISSRAAESPILSYGGMFMVVLMAWSFQTELTMSIWLSSLFQACVAILGIPYVVRNFLG